MSEDASDPNSADMGEPSGQDDNDDPYRSPKIFFAGGVAGAVSRTCTAPMDRVKMLLQVEEGRRMTVTDGFRRMLAEGSVRSFFKGNGTNVLKIAPETALKLAVNDRLKYLVVQDQEDIHPAERLVAGSIAGATAQFMIYPLEVIRTRLAVFPNGTYKGVFHAARTIMRQEGLPTFYRGLLPSMVGILPYAGVDIAIFETLKEELLERYDGNPPVAAILTAGMLSSTAAQFVSYPLALTRTRLQAQGFGKFPVKYSGMVDVLTVTFRNEGFRGLYKGLLPNMLKLAPAASISWLVFEELKSLLGV